MSTGKSFEIADAGTGQQIVSASAYMPYVPDTSSCLHDMLGAVF